MLQGIQKHTYESCDSQDSFVIERNHVFSVTAGNNMVDIANIVNFNQLSCFKPIIPVLKSEKAFSKIIVNANAAIKRINVIITCFQNFFPLFILFIYSLIEKSFFITKYISNDK